MQDYSCFTVWISAGESPLLKNEAATRQTDSDGMRNISSTKRMTATYYSSTMRALARK